jgi:hypothetical protein
MTERSKIQSQAIAARVIRPFNGQQRFTDLGGQNRDLNLVVALSLIGLLATLNLMFHFPEFGAIIAQYNQF